MREMAPAVLPASDHWGHSPRAPRHPAGPALGRAAQGTLTGTASLSYWCGQKAPPKPSRPGRPALPGVRPQDGVWHVGAPLQATRLPPSPTLVLRPSAPALQAAQLHLPVGATRVAAGPGLKYEDRRMKNPPHASDSPTPKPRSRPLLPGVPSLPPESLRGPTADSHHPKPLGGLPRPHWPSMGEASAPPILLSKCLFTLKGVLFFLEGGGVAVASLRGCREAPFVNTWEIVRRAVGTY